MQGGPVTGPVPGTPPTMLPSKRLAQLPVRPAPECSTKAQQTLCTRKPWQDDRVCLDVRRNAHFATNLCQLHSGRNSCWPEGAQHGCASTSPLPKHKLGYLVPRRARCSTRLAGVFIARADARDAVLHTQWQVPPSCLSQRTYPT